MPHESQYADSPGLAHRKRQLAEAKEAERLALRKRSLLPFDVPDPVVGPGNPEGRKRQQAERALRRQLAVAKKLGR